MLQQKPLLCWYMASQRYTKTYNLINIGGKSLYSVTKRKIPLLCASCLHTCRWGGSRLSRYFGGTESQASPFQSDRLHPSLLLLSLLGCCSRLSINQALLQLLVKLRLCLSLCLGIVSSCLCSLFICLDLYIVTELRESLLTRFYMFQVRS